MTLRLRLLDFWLRRVEKPAMARGDPLEVRRRFERQGRLFRDPPFYRYRQVQLAGRPATWAEAGPFRRGVILWLHGGAHVMGSPRTHRAMLARLAAMSATRACLPDFRLAPEHPYPAALDDAEAAWDALRAAGHAGGDVVLGGDSSGGNLAFALLARLLARGERPAGVVAFSPFTDFTGDARSLQENAEADALLPASRFADLQRYYLGDTDPRDPEVSPLFADFPGCPPVWLHAAQTEILRDDTLRLAERLRGQGAEVETDLWAHLPHVSPIFQGWLPEADEVLRRAARFIRGRFPEAS